MKRSGNENIFQSSQTVLRESRNVVNGPTELPKNQDTTVCKSMINLQKSSMK